MAATGRYVLKWIILGTASFFLFSTLRFRMRLIDSFYNGKVFILISLVSVLINIISGLSSLEIRSSCLFIYFLSVPESSPPVSTRIVLILVSVIYRSRNRSSFIIFSLNIISGRRGTLYIFKTRGSKNTRLLFIYIYWLATSSLRGV